MAFLPRDFAAPATPPWLNTSSGSSRVMAPLYRLRKWSLRADDESFAGWRAQMCVRTCSNVLP